MGIKMLETKHGFLGKLTKKMVSFVQTKNDK